MAINEDGPPGPPLSFVEPDSGTETELEHTVNVSVLVIHHEMGQIIEPKPGPGTAGIDAVAASLSSCPPNEPVTSPLLGGDRGGDSDE